MGKKLKLVTALALAGFLYSCGGGGGGGSSSGSSSNEQTRTITGGVSASIVANATICLEDANGNVLLNGNNELCVNSAADGSFTINVPNDVSLNDTQIALFVKDQDGNLVKVAEAPLTEVQTITKQLDPNATENVVDVNPLSLTEGNQTLAVSLGALIHAIAGDTTGNATVLDLGNATIEEITDANGEPVILDKPIEELLKEKKELKVVVKHGNKQLEAVVNSNNGTVECNVDGKKVKLTYELEKHKQEWFKHLQEIIQKYLQHQNQNSEHPVQTQGQTQQQQGGTETVTEVVNSNANTSNIMQHQANQTQSENSNETFPAKCPIDSLNNVKFVPPKVSENQVVDFLKALNGKKVYTWDGNGSWNSCDVEFNETDNSFKFTNCTDPDDDEGYGSVTEISGQVVLHYDNYNADAFVIDANSESMCLFTKDDGGIFCLSKEPKGESVKDLEGHYWALFDWNPQTQEWEISKDDSGKIECLGFNNGKFYYSTLGEIGTYSINGTLMKINEKGGGGLEKIINLLNINQDQKIVGEDFSDDSSIKIFVKIK